MGRILQNSVYPLKQLNLEGVKNVMVRLNCINDLRHLSAARKVFLDLNSVKEILIPHSTNLLQPFNFLAIIGMTLLSDHESTNCRKSLYREICRSMS